MALEFRKKLVIFSGTVTVEDTESLVTWLQKKPGAKADFTDCEHVHPANLQALLAASATVSTWPTQTELAGWLKSLFVAT